MIQVILLDLDCVAWRNLETISNLNTDIDDKFNADVFEIDGKDLFALSETKLSLI